MKQRGEQLAEEALKMSAEALTQQIRATESQVRVAAKNLVEYADFLREEWRKTQNFANSLPVDADPLSEVLRFQKRMVKSKTEFQLMMRYVLDLQNKVNSFLGQTIKMVYTYIDPKTGKVELYEFKNTIDHLQVSQASSKKGGHFTGRIAFNKKAREVLTKIQPKNNYNPDSLNKTFAEVRTRALISKAKTKMVSAFYVYWNSPDGWQLSKVSGMGVLGEAYFSFFINEYTFKTFMEEAVGELAVEEFMTHKKYGVEAVDNVSGFLQGDVTVKTSQDHIEYGVKAQGGSALSYIEIINYAREMSNTPDLMAYLTNSTVGSEGLKERLAAEGKAHLANRVNDALTKTEENLLKELMDTGKWDKNIKLF